MKTLKDCLLEGGIKGKKFVDPSKGPYGVKDLFELGKGSKTSYMLIEGKTEGSAFNDYLRKLTFCLAHKEYKSN